MKIIFSAGVLLPGLNHSATIFALNATVLTGYTQITSSHMNQLLIKFQVIDAKFNGGLLNEAQFTQEFTQLLKEVLNIDDPNFEVNQDQLQHAWNAMLGQDFATLQTIVTTLQAQNHDVTLVSSTNPWHHQRILSEINLPNDIEYYTTYQTQKTKPALVLDLLKQQPDAIVILGSHEHVLLDKVKQWSEEKNQAIKKGAPGRIIHELNPKEDIMQQLQALKIVKAQSPTMI